MKGLKTFALALAFAVSQPALAQDTGIADDYPNRPVHVVVPFPPGGGVDVLIRAVATELDKEWGHRFIVENRPGAASLIGAETVSRAPADGYTLLATINQTITSNRFVFKNLPYDPDEDFMPVSLMVSSDQILLANADMPTNSLQELVSRAREQEHPFAYGSFGNGSQPHLLYETLKSMADLDLIHVPYKGIAPVLTGLAGGEIQFALGSANVAQPLVEAGRIKPIAIAGEHRSPIYPDVPTTSEEGYRELLATVWYAVFAPAGTPEPVINKLADKINTILKKPEFVAQHLAPRGLDLVAGGPQELANTIERDVALTETMAKAADLQPE